VSEQAAVLGVPRRFESHSKSPIGSLRVIIAALVVVAAIGYLVYNGFQSTSVYYLTVKELKAKGADVQSVRVAGIVAANSIQRTNGDSTVHFVISDAGAAMPVTYKGLVPDIFAPGIQVVVEGHYNNASGVFEATTLLAKCPSKFTAAVPTPITGQ